MSLEPYPTNECINNTGRSIESHGKTYTYYGNFEAPNNRIRELIRDNPGNRFYSEYLTKVTNQVLFEGELMRRGFEVLPADKIMAKQQNGRDLPGDLAIFVADDLDTSLFYRFKEAVRDSEPDGLDLISGGKVALEAEEISLLVDQTLMLEDFRPLLDFYDAHMERVREFGNVATASEIV